MLSQKKLLRQVDADKVREAIVRAEKVTSGEVRVSVSRFFWGDVQRTAEKSFEHLGMKKTAARNGILFFVVPSRRRFAVIGDVGIHEKVGDAFWQKVVEKMAKQFAERRYTEALIAGIEEAGLQLALHFPYQGKADLNELPDEVDIH